MNNLIGFDNYYITKDGTVINKKNKRIVKQRIEINGYVRVGIYKNSIQKMMFVHRLVAETYIPNPDNKPQVNHIDGDKQNNHVSNLEWCTASENFTHARETGLYKGWTVESRKKNSKSHINKNFTKTHIDNLSGDKNHNARTVKNSRGELFGSMSLAALSYGVSARAISQAVRKKCKSVNLFWEYA